MILRTGLSLSDFAFFSSSSNLVMILLQNQSIIEGWGKLWQFFCSCPNLVIGWFPDWDLGGTFHNKEQTGFNLGHDGHMIVTIPIFLSEASAGNGGGGASGKINQETLFCPTSPSPPTNVWAPQKTFRKREHNITKVFHLLLGIFFSCWGN